jgi:sporulation protein YlmC with PRC-barrel domain
MAATPRDRPAEGRGVSDQPVAPDPAAEGAPAPAQSVPLAFDAAVHAGGNRIGTLHQVAVDPDSRRITHLIVRTGVAPVAQVGPGRTVAVPADLVTRVEADGDSLVLHVHEEQVQRLPAYEELEVPVDTDAQRRGTDVDRANNPINRADYGEEVTDSAFMASGRAVEHRQRGIPDHLVTIGEDHPVSRMGEEETGKLQRLLVDPATGQLTQVVVRRGGLGPFFGKDVAVPAAWVLGINESGIILGAEAGDLDQVPEYKKPSQGHGAVEPRWPRHDG